MYRSIVVGVFNADSARRAAGRAAEVARASGATLHLVMAFRGSHLDELGGSEERRHAEGLLEQVAHVEAAGAPAIRRHALPGRPVDVILQVAEEQHADLVVVGNQGMTGIHRLLGSVPNDVAHASPCDVLIVKTD